MLDHMIVQMAFKLCNEIIGEWKERTLVSCFIRIIFFESFLSFAEELKAFKEEFDGDSKT